jgi:hypothetical protein
MVFGNGEIHLCRNAHTGAGVEENENESSHLSRNSPIASKGRDRSLPTPYRAPLRFSPIDRLQRRHPF